jgi:hypothetical protein
MTNPNSATITPTLEDVTDGCWGDPGPGSGRPLNSVIASGLAFTLQGGALQTFVQTNYTNLKSTITQLSTVSVGNHPLNVSPAVASQLTDGSSKCFDVSLSLFNKAMNESTPQQTYDFQDAADLLTNADTATTGTTTCESVVLNNIPVSGAFQDTPPAPPLAAVYNPSGHLEYRLAEISNAIRMRILNEPPASTWPPPVSLSVSPQYMFGSLCAPQQCPQLPPPVTPEVMTATLSWALVNDPALTNCSWAGTTDPSFTATPPNPNPLTTSSVTVGPFTPPAYGSAAQTYKYELTCNVPATTVPSSTVTLTAAPSGSGYMGGTLTGAGWPNSTGTNYGVTLSTGQSMSPCTFTQGSTAFTCPPTSITGAPSTTIEVSPPLSAWAYLTVWPAILMQVNPPGSVTAGTQVAITWTPPTGATGCTLITNGSEGNAGLSGTTSGNSGGTAYYTPNAADQGTTVTFTAYCAAGASAGVASIVVLAPVVVTTTNIDTTDWYVNWTPPDGAIGCTLSAYRLVGMPPQQQNTYGTLSGTQAGNGAASGPATTYQASYAGNSNDGTVYFTASCNSGAAPGTTSVNVPE